MCQKSNTEFLFYHEAKTKKKLLDKKYKIQIFINNESLFFFSIW